MHYSKMAALATAGVLALGLSGCTAPGGGGTGSGEQADASASASAPTSVELTQGSFVEELSAAQREAGTVHMTMAHSGAGAKESSLPSIPLEADIDITDPGSPAIAMHTEVEGEAADAILVDGDFYLTMGDTTSGRFLSLSEASASDNPMASIFEMVGDLMLNNLKDMDPAAQLQGIQGAITSFEKTGAETLEGVETDVYTLLVDPAKMTGPQVEELPDDVLAEMGPMEIVYNVDQENLPRAFALTMELKGQPVVTDATFTGWGEPVDVAAPSGDQLITLDEMLETTAG